MRKNWKELTLEERANYCEVKATYFRNEVEPMIHFYDTARIFSGIVSISRDSYYYKADGYLSGLLRAQVYEPEIIFKAKDILIKHFFEEWDYYE